MGRVNRQMYVCRPVLDPWQSLAELFNLLTRVDIHHIKLYSVEDIDYHSGEFIWLRNQEELNLKGFLPLMNMSQDDMFIKSNTDVDEVTT